MEIKKKRQRKGKWRGGELNRVMEWRTMLGEKNDERLEKIFLKLKIDFSVIIKSQSKIQ